MRILIDECINPRRAVRLRSALPGHLIATVRERGWAGRKDPWLVQEAQSGFDIFIAIDKGFAFEHNLGKISLGIVVVETDTNQMPSYERILPELLAAVPVIQPGEVQYVLNPAAT
jgi:predicted nuclease of predicted toxin-antitoxin system